MNPVQDSLYYHYQNRFFSPHERVEDLDVDSSMSFERIIGSMNLMRSEGLNASKMVLGTEQYGQLLADSNFNRASSMSRPSPGGGQIGTIVGVPVESADVRDLSVLITEGDSEQSIYFI